MTKILSIFGTRSKAIKMAPVVRELMSHPDRFTSLVCMSHTHNPYGDGQVAARIVDILARIELR